MARSGINKVILVGNLGADPDVRTTAGGAAVTTLSLATSDSWKDKETGADQKKTEWHRIILWNRLAENAGKYLKKGSKIYIEGQLQYRNYEQDGQTKYITEIVARDMQFLDSRGSSDSSYEDASQDAQTEDVPESGITDDDIPF
jgi:single-strand DNA-binding protein